LIRNVTAGTRLQDGGVIVADDEYLAVVELLKQLTWYYVIDQPSLEAVQRGQARLIRSLYGNLIEWVEEAWRGPGESSRGHRRELPARLLEFLDTAFLYDLAPTDEYSRHSDNKRISRAVIDYIVSLTEGQAIALNARLTGHSAGSILENWLYI
jgi:dGTPase